MRKLSFALFARRQAIGLGLALIGAALVSAPSPAWEFDGGGRVGDYLDLVATANYSDSRIEISGVCASACTMKLGAHGACVRPDAELMFHAARNPDGRVNALATMILMQEYPPAIRAWALNSGALTSTRLVSLSGAQAIALGVRNCERTDPVHMTRIESPLVSRPAAAEGPVCRAASAAPFCPRAYQPVYARYEVSFLPHGR